jgi:prephenate dehydratase
MTHVQHESHTSLKPPPAIVIQGVPGAFHEIAARRHFGQHIRVVPALSFEELTRLTLDPACADGAVMAIENSIVGSILGNYHLVKNHPLHITGEVYLRISQNLLALPGVSLSEITEVHSHPMALAQCAAFFQQHPQIRLVESADTAASAEQISREQLRHRAAIGSTLAAEVYGLALLAPGIETNPVNFTRFWVLERGQAQAHRLSNKASVCFTTAHQPGSLSRILGMLSAEGANLTKIESMPLLGKAWEYQFFLDFTLQNPARMPATLQLLDAMSCGLQVMGLYAAAATHLTLDTL